MVSIKNASAMILTAFFLLSTKNVHAHLKSGHPNSDQCQCAHADEAWHFHFLQKTSKHKTTKRADFDLPSEEKCDEQRHQRLKWDVFICP